MSTSGDQDPALELSLLLSKVLTCPWYQGNSTHVVYVYLSRHIWAAAAADTSRQCTRFATPGKACCTGDQIHRYGKQVHGWMRPASFHISVIKLPRWRLRWQMRLRTLFSSPAPTARGSPGPGTLFLHEHNPPPNLKAPALSGLGHRELRITGVLARR